jgi:lysophospholipase L1-like esterase
VKFRILLIILVCIASGCVPVGPTLEESSGGDMSIRYLALGDSYTIGESVAENERWPVQLADALKRNGQDVDVTIIARTGWTTDELWDGVQKVGPQGPFDLVSLLIGVNNQYRGYDINEYREGFRFLLNKSIEYAGGKVDRVFVVSIPDWGVTPFASGRDAAQIAAEIDAFNVVNREESEAAGVLYVDITPISRVNDPALIADDGLHPSGKMYGQWVEKMLPEMLGMFKSR